MRHLIWMMYDDLVPRAERRSSTISGGSDLDMRGPQLSVAALYACGWHTICEMRRQRRVWLLGSPTLRAENHEISERQSKIVNVHSK